VPATRKNLDCYLEAGVQQAFVFVCDVPRKLFATWPRYKHYVTGSFGSVAWRFGLTSVVSQGNICQELGKASASTSAEDLTQTDSLAAEASYTISRVIVHVLEGGFCQAYGKVVCLHFITFQTHSAPAKEHLSARAVYCGRR